MSTQPLRPGAAGPAPSGAQRPWQRLLLEALQASGCRFVAYVPDSVWKVFLEEAAGWPSVRLVPLCREEEGIGVLAGLFLGGQRGVLVTQASGVGNCLNALGSLAIAQRIPVVMLVTERGGLGETIPSHLPFDGRLARVLEAMGIACYPVQETGQLGRVVQGAFQLAYTCRTVACVLVSPWVTGPGA
ncbi:MAG TPA: hypothetical protein VIL11_04885 [Limnochordales bacterium]